MKAKPILSTPLPPTMALLLWTALAAPFISPNARAATPEWFHVATNPPAALQERLFHGMVYDSVRGMTIMHGGLAGGQVLADTWAWDGRNWTRLTQQGPATMAFSIAFDSDRGVAVLHGGFNSSWQVIGGTWEWDGQTWRRVNINAGPGARGSSAMAYDPVRRRVVLHGGTLDVQGNTLLSDTWAWDGTTWSEIPNANGPTRTLHQIVYDQRREVMVLFGGIDARGSGPVDTWEFDGTQWHQVATNGPPGGREIPILGYDPLRGVTILTSGGEWPQDGFPAWKYFDDTWEWNGTQWTEVTPEGTRPQKVQATAGALDLRRGRLVQFGGSPDPDIHLKSRETWEYGFPELRLTSIDHQADGSFLIQWTGGAPPYQLQSCTNLSEGDWQDLDATTDQTSATNPPVAPRGFIRVLRAPSP